MNGIAKKTGIDNNPNEGKEAELWFGTPNKLSPTIFANQKRLMLKNGAGKRLNSSDITKRNRNPLVFMSQFKPNNAENKDHYTANEAEVIREEPHHLNLND